MPLHYRPADGFVGDVIPFFWRGIYHLFYLKAPLPPARSGAHATPWAHIASRNLADWDELPLAVIPGRQGAPDSGGCWTGSVLRSEDVFHMFYTGHAPDDPQRPQTICHAVSIDLVQWAKDRRNPVLLPDPRWYERSDWRDPFVLWNGVERCYWMLITARLKDAPTPRAGCIALAKSTDLERWEVHPPLWAPYLVHAPECPDVFPLAERWYMLFSTVETRYRVGLSPSGPWGTPAVESLDGPRFYAAKSLSDGKRRLLFGWVATREGERDSGAWEWGGDLSVPRQLEPAEDGGLVIRCPEEVAGQFGPPMFYPDEIAGFEARLGRWMPSAQMLVGESQSGFAYAICPEISGDFAARLELTIDAPPTRAGLLLRAGDKLQRGYVLMLEPLLQRITLRPWQSWGDGEPFVERPLRIIRGEPISLQLVLEGSIVEVLAGDRCCLTSRLYDHRGGSLGLFVENGMAEFSGITVWSLPKG
jgi:beta-fructofuranosidase